MKMDIAKPAHWHAWLECLCRLGQLQEALKSLCLEMGKGEDDVEPDEDCIRILFKFARQEGMVAEVHTRVQRYLPTLWKRLPEDLTR